MQKNFYDTNFIEAYLMQELPQEEVIALENAMQGDLQLKNEVLFQKDILNAIQEKRKLELKARLNQVEIPTGVQAPFSKIIAFGVAVLATISLVWYLTNELSEQTTKANIITTLPESNDAIADKETNNEKVEAVQAEEKSNNAQNPEKETVLETEAVVSEEQKVLKRPTESKSLEKKGDETIASVKKEEKEDFNYQIYYQYHQNVLSLYEDVKYQLIKSDIGDGEKSYLYVKDAFFELKADSSAIFNLKDTQVTDKEKISKLRALLK